MNVISMTAEEMAADFAKHLTADVVAALGGRPQMHVLATRGGHGVGIFVVPERLAAEIEDFIAARYRNSRVIARDV